MRAKKNQNIGLCLSTFLFSIFLSASTWAAPNMTAASTNNLKVYLEQIIGNDSYRNYKNIEELQRVSAWIKEQMRLFVYIAEQYIFNAQALKTPHGNPFIGLDGKSERQHETAACQLLNRARC